MQCVSFAYYLQKGLYWRIEEDRVITKNVSNLLLRFVHANSLQELWNSWYNYGIIEIHHGLGILRHKNSSHSTTPQLPTMRKYPSLNK
jgi:hypothetical protein